MTQDSLHIAEEINLKNKIKFGPQEFAAIIAENISAAFFVSKGIPQTQAKLMGTGVAGIIKGLSLEKKGTSEETILGSIDKISKAVLYESSLELSDSIKEELSEQILNPKKVISFMCQPEINNYLRDQIRIICENDSDCDISTFLVDELVAEMVSSFEQEVLKNHELATYATYCLLRKTTQQSVINIANEQYVKSFREPLFLHKSRKGTRCNLSNLFVLPKYIDIKDHCDDTRNDLENYITDFIREENKSFLFIEGDAGCGKTTLVAWMNYLFSLGDETAIKLFGIRPLITIRLRDLNREDLIKSKSLSYAIRRYMNLPSLDDLEYLFPQAVMILDGFDELCMIEGINNNHEGMLYDLYNKELNGFKFIVTTRPKFISYRIDIPSRFVSLTHFDVAQRSIWLEKYTSDKYCGETLETTVYDYIKNIEDDTSSCICDTPMTLYMLAAKKGSADYLENSWALYHHIFYEELTETEYNKMFPDPDRNYSHDIRDLREVLYQISEEIAFRMYQRNNNSFYLTEHELSEIVIKLSNDIPILKRADMQNIAEHCYALCCYWKANSDRGVVEFLHNNIRDFFLAEKIYRVMDEMIHNARNNDSQEKTYKEIAKQLCSMFQYGVLETKVTEFIFLRSLFNWKNNISDFAKYEYQHNLVYWIIVYFSRDGLRNVGESSDIFYVNLVERITNILTCTVQLYRNAYEPHLREDDLIPWTPPNPVYSNILTPLFKSIFCQVPVTLSSDYMISLGSCGRFTGLNFKSSDLRNIDFTASCLKNVDFSDAVLSGCNFSYSELDGANFTNADIHYASLQNASLIGCQMTGADLRGTELPDGFVSIDQNEQVEHLKSLQIPELKI